MEPGVRAATVSPPLGRRRSRTPEEGHQRLVKASFNIPADELEALKELADRRQTSATQVLRESLRTERYIQELVDSGASIMAKFGRRSLQLVFSHMT
jgi:hypothetical protein